MNKKTITDGIIAQIYKNKIYEQNIVTTKTPTEIVFDFFSAIRLLLESVFSDRITISEQAWNVIGYILFLLSVYYFKEPIFTEAFWPLMVILSLSVISEVIIRNFPKLNRKFMGTATYEDICRKGLNEENVVDALKRYNIDSESLDKIVNELDCQGNITVRILEALIQNQKLSTKLVSEILDEEPPSSTLIDLLWNNRDTLKYEQLGRVYEKWKQDKGVICTCLMTQRVAADVIGAKLGTPPETFRRYNLRYSSLTPALKKFVYYFVLPILVIIAVGTYFPTKNLVTASSYTLAVGVFFAVYLALIRIIDELMKRAYYYFLERNCVSTLTKSIQTGNLKKSGH